jgi:hypothetical protein
MRLTLFLIFIGTILSLAAWQVTVNTRKAEELQKQAQVIEDSAAAEPTKRSVLLGDKFLDCYTFPMRTYDNLLVRCFACEKDTGIVHSTSSVTVFCQ